MEHKTDNTFVDRGTKDMENIKNKRQIYLWPENKDFWDKLPNKSKFMNLLIKQYREENEVDNGTAA